MRNQAELRQKLAASEKRELEQAARAAEMEEQL